MEVFVRPGKVTTGYLYNTECSGGGYGNYNNIRMTSNGRQQQCITRWIRNVPLGYSGGVELPGGLTPAMLHTQGSISLH